MLMGYFVVYKKQRSAMTDINLSYKGVENSMYHTNNFGTLNLVTLQILALWNITIPFFLKPPDLVCGWPSRIRLDVL